MGVEFYQTREGELRGYYWRLLSPWLRPGVLRPSCLDSNNRSAVTQSNGRARIRRL